MHAGNHHVLLFARKSHFGSVFFNQVLLKKIYFIKWKCTWKMKMFDAFKKRYKHVWCLLSLPFLLVKPSAHMYTLQLFNTHSHTYFYMYFNTSSRSHPPTVWFNVLVSFYFLSLLLLLLSLSEEKEGETQFSVLNWEERRISISGSRWVFVSVLDWKLKVHVVITFIFLWWIFICLSRRTYTSHFIFLSIICGCIV